MKSLIRLHHSILLTLAGLIFCATDAEAGRAYGVSGNRGRAVAGSRGVAWSGENSSGAVGQRGTAIATDNGVAARGRYGAVAAGDNGVAVAGRQGVAVAGDNGVAVAGRPYPTTLPAYRAPGVVAPVSSGYVRVLPSGSRMVVYGGYSCFFVGGVYYRPVFYGGETIYVVVQ